MKIKPFKQLLAFSLLLCLLLSYCAFAEDAPLTAETFSLRNGYTFGMTMDEARKLAGEEGLVAGESPDEQTLVYLNVPMGNDIARDFVLCFDLPDMRLSGLTMMLYRSEVFSAAESTELNALFDTLASSLSQKYGSPDSETDFSSRAWFFNGFIIVLSNEPLEGTSDFSVSLPTSLTLVITCPMKTLPRQLLEA